MRRKGALHISCRMEALALLWQHNLCRKRPVLAVPGKVTAVAGNDFINPYQPETMPFPLRCLKNPAAFCALLSGGKIGKGDIKLGSLHVD